MVYRSINREAPNYLTALFDRLSDISVIESFVILKHEGHFTPKRSRTLLMKILLFPKKSIQNP